jgi:3-dehydroquinate dehydratase-2
MFWMQDCLFLSANQSIMHLIIINGPNLNLLGKREPELYGSQSFEDYLVGLRKLFPEVKIDYFQSNDEGALVSKIQEVGFTIDAIVLNAAAYTHTSVAIADAVAAVSSPVIEVHITNPYSREEFRRKSYLSPYCKALVSGFGLDSYALAIQGILRAKRL